MSNASKKIERLRQALSFQQPDRVPVGEFFWTGFLKQARAKWGSDFDPYRHFDLDYIVINPNMDPLIREFEVLRQEGEEIVLKTGFGATIRRSGEFPMPHFDGFSVAEPEQMKDFAFDDPADPRRFYTGGDDQINCVGDALARHIPSWEARLTPYVEDFAVFGGICECYEYVWRCIGSENALMWMAADADLFEAFIQRIGQFVLRLTEAQIIAGKGRLSGMYIWGDVAYRNGMLFSPETWRRVFKPHVQKLIELCHQHGLMVIYHGCGNASPIYEDLAAMHLDAYNPLEVKAGLDVVPLRRQYAGRLAFCGNVDVRVLESGDADAIRREVRYKLGTALGGGYIFQSDHSISSSVSPESYALAIQTLREFGNFSKP